MNVSKVRSVQFDFPTAERVTGRRCPSCQTAQPEQWTKVMQGHYGDA
ncbi:MULTISPECIES: hypothetical protein [unclassified Streptomyces]